MTDERIRQLRDTTRDLREVIPNTAGIIWECLDTIVALKAEIKDANKAVKLAMKGRK
jgi:hypothetical protein